MTKIAIIEDDAAISQMYRIKFEAEGYQVESAENGRLGLTLLREVQPDITLLDLMMPEMNGDEVLEKMRAADWGKNLKVIVLTNMGEDELPMEVRTKYSVLAVIQKADMTPRQVFDRVQLELSEA
jgi:DNA-binding response OmpR family regulator